MENLKQTIMEKKNHDGEETTREVFREKKFMVPKISWPAIFSGVLVAAVSQLLLSLLGVGIGMASIDPIAEQKPLEGIGIATVIWWSVTMFVSLFIGGWTTGRVYSAKVKGERTIHGLLTWCTFTVFSFLMLSTSVGMLISGIGNIVGPALTAGASVAQNDPDISNLLNDARNIIMQPGTVTGRGIPATGQQGAETSALQAPGTAGQANNQLFLSSVENFFRGGDINNPETREALINSLIAQTGMSRTEANAKVDSWITSYENLKVQAQVKADQAARATSIASIVFFFALIIGALVTVLGARVAPSDEYQPAVIA